MLKHLCGSDFCAKYYRVFPLSQIGMEESEVASAEPESSVIHFLKEAFYK